MASVSSTIVDNPWLSSGAEKIGIICIMGYFLWHKDKECKDLKVENRELTQKIINKCPSCELAKAANKLLIDDEDSKK